MTGLYHETSALNVLHRFHRVDMVLFVEGDDDVCFWAVFLKRAGLSRTKVIPVGGVTQIQEKAQRVVDEDAAVVVAMDKDHSPFVGGALTHRRVVRTYGYSIENTMYCPRTLNSVCRKLSRTDADRFGEIRSWYDEFCTATREVLVCDIANHKYARGIAGFTDNCCRFLSSQRSPRLSVKRLGEHVGVVKTRFGEDELLEVEALIKADRRERRHLLKGHFLTHAVINLLKGLNESGQGKQPSLSLDALYATTCDGCAACDAACSERTETVNALKEAAASLGVLSGEA